MEGMIIPDFQWSLCQDPMLVGFFPTVTLWFLTMKGKTVCHVRTTFMNVLAVGGLGYIGLRITCSADDMGYITFFHLLPFLVLGLVSGLLARKIYRW